MYDYITVILNNSSNSPIDKLFSKNLQPIFTIGNKYNDELWWLTIQKHTAGN